MWNKTCYCNEYTPQLLTKSYPKSLSDLHDCKLTCLSYKELIDYCQKVNIVVTAEQWSNVEVRKRKQHLSKSWFHFTTGRITHQRYIEFVILLLQIPQFLLLSQKL